jgi:hypothetical protein
MKTTATVGIYYSNSSTLARTTVFKGTKSMDLDTLRQSAQLIDMIIKSALIWQAIQGIGLETGQACDLSVGKDHMSLLSRGSGL